MIIMKKIYLTLLAAMALTLGACSSSNDQSEDVATFPLAAPFTA